MENNDLSEYKLLFQDVFESDITYSRKFAKAADAIITRNLVEIHNHEKRTTVADCVKDSEGADRTFNLQFTVGVRVRRPGYVHFGDFTMDTKEFGKLEQPDYYISGYGRDDEKSFAFYMLWNQKQFIKLAKEGKIKRTLCHNYKHSKVEFWAFKFKDIYDQCDVLECGGDPEPNRQVLDDRPIVNGHKLGEFL